MLLVSTSMAMRGDNVRPICWSDLLARDVQLVNMGDDFRIKVCSMLLLITICPMIPLGLGYYQQSGKD